MSCKRFMPLLLWLALSPAWLASPAAAQDSPPRPAKLMTLAPQSALFERRFYGRITARETVDLAFQVGGQVLEFPVEEGGRLQNGAPIARLDLAPFERRVAQARVNLDKARRDHDRLSALEGSSVAEVQIHDARTQLDLARIALDEAEEQLEHASLHAPFDALVARRLVATFSTVTAGQPVARLHDMSEMRVEIDVPEVLFRRAQGGGEVTFSASFPGDTARYPLALREYEAETADVGQTFRLTLAFLDDPGEWLLPGASTTVTASLSTAGATALFVPDTALIFDAERSPYVMEFTADADNPDTGTVSRRPVAVEMLDDGRIALTEGPDAGREIVMAGASQLRDGQRVRRFVGMGN